MRFLADENFNGHMLDGLLKKNPDMDIVRVQDTEMYQQPDPNVLAYAAREGRILLSHDVTTMSKYANDRIEAGLPMPGVVLIPDSVSIGRAIEDILTIIGASDPDEWEGRVEFLPL